MVIGSDVFINDKQNKPVCPKCGAELKKEFQGRWHRRTYCPKCDYIYTEYIGPIDGGKVGPDKIDWA